MAEAVCEIEQRAKAAGIEDALHAIEIRDVTVSFRSYQERPSTLKESLLRFLTKGRVKSYSTFNALQDVNVWIKRGKVLGIVGSNGSGKSTLLKVIAGVLKPTEGRVSVDGSVASLIELGAGFDPELNAIENIYLHSSLHGKSRKEIKERVPGIIDFAELHDFAQTPVKYYSSGMYARLGFAVAMDIDPDILLVDEILAVGDERFQKKSYERFQDFIRRGKTLIFVSHDLDSLEQIADDTLVLQCGQVIYQGAPDRALEIYRDITYQSALR